MATRASALLEFGDSSERKANGKLVSHTQSSRIIPERGCDPSSTVSDE